jgi:hypothetical protein
MDGFINPGLKPIKLKGHKNVTIIPALAAPTTYVTYGAQCFLKS